MSGKCTVEVCGSDILRKERRLDGEWKARIWGEIAREAERMEVKE